MPFEVLESRVKIVRDEAVGESSGLRSKAGRPEYTCLQRARTAQIAGNREEVEKHSVRRNGTRSSRRSSRRSSVAWPADRCGVGWADRATPADDQRRFPMQIATSLSQSFAHQGLQFFKVEQDGCHVWVARPHFLDLKPHRFRMGSKRIVEFIMPIQRQSVNPIEALAVARACATPLCPRRKGKPRVLHPQSRQLLPNRHPSKRRLRWIALVGASGHVIEFANGQLDDGRYHARRSRRPNPSAKPATPATDAASGQLLPC